MAEFQLDTPTEAFLGMYATALQTGTTATEAERLASNAALLERGIEAANELRRVSGVVKVTDSPNKPPTPPEVARLDRAFAVLPFVVLALILALLLAGCRSEKRPTTGTGGATSTQQQPGAADPLQGVVESVSTAVAGIAPSANTTPVFVWNFANSPTPYPSATPDTNCSHTGLCGWDVLQNGGAK